MALCAIGCLHTPEASNHYRGREPKRRPRFGDRNRVLASDAASTAGTGSVGSRAARGRGWSL